MVRSLPRTTSSRRPRSRSSDAALRRLTALPASASTIAAADWSELLAMGLAANVGGTILLTAAGAARLRRLDAVDAGTPPWIAQHTVLRAAGERDGAGAGAIIDEGESPLAWLRRRKDKDGQPLIDAAAFAAGERLRADITRAGVLPRTTADWSALGGAGPSRTGGPVEVLHGTIAARQSVDRAIAAVGSDFAGLLLDVCGFLKGLETVEAERGWPARSAKVVLVMALRRLADHYGYATVVRGPDRSRGVRTWSALADEPSRS